MPDRPTRYPISLNLSDQPVLVVGGGKVAARKVLRLLRAGAQVTLVSPVVTEELEALATAGALRWLGRAFHARDVAGKALVFTATGREDTDRAVASSARAVGTLVNSADQAVAGDFDLPALLERGPLQVAVSTSGAAPGFAATLARELSASVPEELGTYVELLDEVRLALRERFAEDGGARQKRFAAALACDEARAHAAAGRVDQARQALRDASR